MPCGHGHRQARGRFKCSSRSSIVSPGIPISSCVRVCSTLRARLRLGSQSVTPVQSPSVGNVVLVDREGTDRWAAQITSCSERLTFNDLESFHANSSEHVECISMASAPLGLYALPVCHVRCRAAARASSGARPGPLSNSDRRAAAAAGRARPGPKGQISAGNRNASFGLQLWPENGVWRDSEIIRPAGAGILSSYLGSTGEAPVTRS